MPTKREREYYRMGFTDGLRIGRGGTAQFGIEPVRDPVRGGFDFDLIEGTPRFRGRKDPSLGLAKPKRKLSDWQKYIKNKRNHIKYRDGKLNLKKMGVEFRRKKRR